MQESSTAIVRARWAVAAIFFVNGFVVGAWAAQIPLVEERLRISHSTLGVALFVLALGTLLAMPLAGPIISRYGSATVLRVAAPALFLILPLLLLAPGFQLLLAAAICFGAANGCMDVAMNAHGVAVERRYGHPVMSSFHGMWSLGALGGAGLAALLLTTMSPLAQACLTVALSLGVAAVGLTYLLPGRADESGGGFRIALPNRATLGLGVLCFLCMTGEGAVFDWGALHLRSSLGVSPSVAASGFAVYSAFMAAARLGGDRLRGRFGAVPLVRASALLAAAGLVVALLVPWPLVAIAAFAVVGIGLANLVPVFFGAAGRIPGQTPGAAIAALATIGYCGFVVGPPFIGVLADATSLRIALGFIVLACLVIALAAGVADPMRRSR